MGDVSVKVTVNAVGLSCPLPVVRTKKAMDTIQSGEVLELLATDKGSLADVKAWTKNGGHELIGSEEADGVFKFYIKKA